MFKQRSYISWLMLASILCLSAQNAHADIGLPMIVILEPLFVAFFLPIVLIESLVFKCYFSDVSYRELLKANFFSNLISTLVGIPLTWIGCTVVAFAAEFVSPSTFHASPTFWDYISEVTLRAPWLVREKLSYWTGPVATMVLLIPCYFVSIWVETKSIQKTLKNYALDQLPGITRKANLASYGVLYGVVIGYLIFQLIKH